MEARQASHRLGNSAVQRSVKHCLDQWFLKWAVPPPGGGEAEMGDWWALKQKWGVGGDRRPS